MKLMAQMRFLEHIDFLIRTKATGTPKDFSKRLNISERKLFRIISDLKSEGFPIAYCKARQCYYYEEEVKINFEISIQNKALLRIKGGRDSFFLSVNFRQ